MLFLRGARRPAGRDYKATDNGAVCPSGVARARFFWTILIQFLFASLLERETGARAMSISAGKLFAFGLAVALYAQQGAKNGEWHHYGADLGNTHYSPLDQITPA